MAAVKSTYSQALPLVEFGVSSRVAPGETESGDAYLVKSIRNGTLLAVVDGAGHGPEAAKASRAAIETLDYHSGEGVIALVRKCHDRLRTTRGAVLGLMVIDGTENTLTWLGVGNIEGLLLRNTPSRQPRTESMFLRPGIVGYRLPVLQAQVVPITAGDLLILTTDGIRRDFVRQFSGEDSPAKIAEYISSNFAKGPDDGLVLVVRYLGSSE